jgi:hypothetical protein
MKPSLIILVVFLIFSACASTKKTNVDADSYGYAQSNPIKTGKGPSGERAYLDRLTGPNGEKVKYERLGSCCPFKTKNGLLDNTGMLDKYEVTYEGLGKKVILYLNMYDEDKLMAPKGFILLTE